MKVRTIELCALIVALGAWLFAMPETFGYESPYMAWSERLSGLVLIAWGIASFSFSRLISVWVVAAVGLWLQFAPLVFWAPEAVSYANDTFVGIILIALAFQLTGKFDIESKKEAKQKDTDAPPGWSYNPSSWLQRGISIALAIVCWFLARYLAAYQLGYIDSVWDPFFGDGTLQVITSAISQDFPVSDAGLGALGYSMEAIMGWQGDTRRWCTMPWMVLTFGIFVVPVSCISILLIILQPIAVGAWCGLCLVIAVCMLIMILLTMSELVAALEFLIDSKRAGKSLWKTLWHGGEPVIRSLVKPRERKGLIAWGITLPWNLLLSVALGVWLISSPSFFGTAGKVADSDYIAGPLLVAVSIISLAESARPARFLNILIGLWLLAAPLILGHHSTAAGWNNYILGAAVILLAFPRGKIREHYGQWDRFIV